MEEVSLERRTGCKRARRASSFSKAMRAVLVVLLAAPNVPSSEALKLSSISEERGHLGVGLLRAVEVVRGRYERAWALVSASEPTAEDLDTALELLQANAKQWESLEPAVKLWTERENEPSRHSSGGGDSSKTAESTKSSKHASEHHHRSSTGASEAADGRIEQQQQQQQEERMAGAPGASDTTSRIYEEAASLLAHNRAVLGQALARSGQADRGIAELEVACPEILEYQQNAQGRRDSKSWLHCYANLADMYKTQKRFEEASSLLARMPWLPSPQGTTTPGGGSAPPSASDTSSAAGDGGGGSGDSRDIPAVPLGTSQAVAGSGDMPEDGSDGQETAAAGLKSPPPDQNHEDETASDAGVTVDTATPASPTPSKSGGGGGGRSDAPPPRGAGAARVAGLNKAAAAASAAAAAESAAAAAGAVETGAEAAARAVVERHAEAMRASMNELVGELAVTTATRPSTSQDWLSSRVEAAEEVLAAVRAGLLSVAAKPEQVTGGGGDSAADTVADVPTMVIGAPGHADILREASHYLSAIKGVAAQGWAYVDNELNRMERHSAQAVKPGFQSRREVIHTFRYLLMKARQYASENQSQSSRTTASGTASSQAGSGSGSRWRRKDRGGRKASTSSKAPRKGSGTRGKSPRSDADSSSTDNDGVLTLLIGAGIALLVAAVSSGGGKGQGRRREAERQRTATRAAKTVGSYVEPPQRTAVAALMLRLWGNLKRSGLVVSSHAINTANLSRTLLFTAWASFFERIRAARASTKSRRAIVAGKATTSAFKKSAGGAQSNNSHKQRSKKNVKKTAAAPARLLVRGDTAVVTPPASPPAATQPAVQQNFAAVVAADVTVSAPVGVSVIKTTEPAGNKRATNAPPRKPAKTAAKAVGTPGSTDTSGKDSAVAAAAGPVASMATAAVQAAANKSAGVPFPDVMTAEQVQAMVEEDERAWEQARVSEKLHSKATAAAAAAAAAAASSSSSSSSSSSAAVAAKAAETEGEDAGGAGWSEVGGTSSRGRASAGSGGARGRVLSIRNVRAAAQAARTSSPGSDPATTTSASSSDSSEGCKEKSRHGQAMETRGGARAPGRQGGRLVVQGAARGTTTLPRAGTKPAWGGAPAQTRGGGLRVEQARGIVAARDTDPAAARTVRAPQTSRSATRTAATPPVSGSGAGKQRSVVVVAHKTSVAATATATAAGVDRGSLAKGASAPALRPAPVPAAAAAAAAGRTQAVSSSLRQPLKSVGSASGGSEDEAGGKGAEDEVPQAAPAQPAAWTNTPSHPLGMQPEPAPLPPASELPCPPPQHQQYWQRQQQREQQRQHHHHQHQHHQHQHFFHQQEPPLMAMPASTVSHQHDVSHHYPPLSSLPPRAHHHGQPPPQQQQQQQQHEVVMPQYISPSEEAFPPPSALMPVPAAASGAASVAPAMVFPIHPAHGPTLPPSPGGGIVAGVHPHFIARDGSFDSPGGGGGGGFSPDAAVVAPPQAMVLPPPYEQQQQQPQQGRFSPPTLQVVPLEEAGGGGGVVSPMYAQQGPGPSSGGGFQTNANVGGGSDGAETFEVLMNALRWQVEYYFSADNLVTDSYLRGLMDPEGFVAVSKIIVFNRVRSMTSDLALLVAAMRRSNELEILEQDHTGETRVRTRHSPLHWTREQLPPVSAPVPPALQEDQHREGESYEQKEEMTIVEEEEEEEEEEEHHITFGNVAEVIGRDEPAPVSASVERGDADSRD